jgi:hypothetical protein
MRVILKIFVDGAGDTRKDRIRVIMDNNYAVFYHFRSDEAKGGFYRGIEVAVEEGEGDIIGDISGREGLKEGFFDSRQGEIFALKAFYEVRFCGKERAGAETVASGRRIFERFLGQTGERIVEIEPRGGLGGVLGSENLREFQRGIASITAELYENAVFGFFGVV